MGSGRRQPVITSTTAPSSHTPAYLGKVVVHAQDIRRPLGLVRTPSVGALTPVADFFARRDFTVASRTQVADLQLRADDGPFATGTGPLVTGSTLALVMSMAWRPLERRLVRPCTGCRHAPETSGVLVPVRITSLAGGQIPHDAGRRWAGRASCLGPVWVYGVGLGYGSRNEPLGLVPAPANVPEGGAHARCRAESQRTGRLCCRGPARGPGRNRRGGRRGGYRGPGGAGADPDHRHLRARLPGLRLTARLAASADASPARRRRCGPGRAAAACAAAFGPDRQRCGVLRSGQPRGCRRGYWQPQHTVPLAAACGACCTP